MRGFSFCVAQFVMAGFRKFQVEKSVLSMTVRIKKIIVYSKKKKKISIQMAFLIPGVITQSLPPSPPDLAPGIGHCCEKLTG